MAGTGFDTWFLNDRVAGVGDLLPLGFIGVLVLHEETGRDKQPQYWKTVKSRRVTDYAFIRDGTSLSGASYALILHLINF